GSTGSGPQPGVPTTHGGGANAGLAGSVRPREWAAIARTNRTAAIAVVATRPMMIRRVQAGFARLTRWGASAGRVTASTSRSGAANLNRSWSVRSVIGGTPSRARRGPAPGAYAPPPLTGR